jgi:hypothetical protein
LYKEKRLDLEKAKLEDDVNYLERKLNCRTKKLSEISGRIQELDLILPDSGKLATYVQELRLAVQGMCNSDPGKKDMKIELQKWKELYQQVRGKEEEEMNTNSG